jgi:hypothetical protein
MKKRICIGTVLWVGFLAAFGLGWPRPSAVPEKGQWTLDVTYEHPVQITMKMPGGQMRRFWYMIISLTNQNSEQEIPFYPKCELVTDTFQILPAGQGEVRGLFELVKAKHQGQFPFLESLDFADHQIRSGKDNTRDFVIVWPDFDARAKTVRFYLAGLSNETTAIGHPVQIDPQGNPVPVYLRKTLQLTYSIGADPQLRQDASLRFEEQDWVMR